MFSRNYGTFYHSRFPFQILPLSPVIRTINPLAYFIFSLGRLASFRAGLLIRSLTSIALRARCSLHGLIHLLFRIVHLLCGTIWSWILVVFPCADQPDDRCTRTHSML